MSNKKHFETKIKDALEKKYEIKEKDKREVWGHIESELFKEEEKGGMKMKKKNKFKGLFLTTAAAAVMMVAFSTQTTTGQAFVSKIKSAFEPEKEIVQQLEGSDEDTNLKLNEGKDSKYAIYVDEERYKMIQEDGKDVIVTKEELPDQYPEVSMTIEQVIEKDPEMMIEEMKGKVSKEYPVNVLDEKADFPMNAHFIMAKKEKDGWNDELIKVYILSNEQGGSFVITQKLFSEAEEGHGSRLDHMLKEFHIVTE